MPIYQLKLATGITSHDRAKEICLFVIGMISIQQICQQLLNLFIIPNIFSLIIRNNIMIFECRTD